MYHTTSHITSVKRIRKEDSVNLGRKNGVLSFIIILLISCYITHFLICHSFLDIVVLRCFAGYAIA